jgi:hypothetical protein
MQNPILKKKKKKDENGLGCDSSVKMLALSSVKT